MRSVIDNQEFARLVSRRAKVLLSISRHLAGQESNADFFLRPLIGDLLSHSTQIEEYLDTYGTKNNNQWSPFRSTVATIKNFSEINYELLNIHHGLPAHRFLYISQDFLEATDSAIDFVIDILLKSMRRLLQQAGVLCLSVTEETFDVTKYFEELPLGKLAADHSSHQVDKVPITATKLSTAFLNLEKDSELVNLYDQIKHQRDIYPYLTILNEENLRIFEFRFHNLQSLYDTHLSESNAESIDADMKILRSDIGIIFHLLKIATVLTHYFERHLALIENDHAELGRQLVDPEMLLEMLKDYCANFVSQYLVSGKDLCQGLLDRYSEIGQIEVNIPRYRGFHVRPSTLISALVLHYGSSVTMEFESRSYDASKPLDIFRVNEKINAQKRRWLAIEIVRLRLVQEKDSSRSINEIVKGIVLVLSEESKLVIYEKPLDLLLKDSEKEGTLLERVMDEISQLQVTGKIDIDVDLKVRFIGDNRVLADIQVLAETGYGEDQLGNNIPLPAKLAFLRK